ncbi:hypothetical protein ACWC5I_31530 [Kitasatospora sp. NPDC001574]
MDATHADTARSLARQAEAALDEGHTDLAGALAVVARLYTRLAATPADPQEELRAVELGDEARMSPAARAARQLARRALTHKDGDIEQIPLKAIAEEYDVSEPTASRYRKAAGELIASGYRPAGT